MNVFLHGFNSGGVELWVKTYSSDTALKAASAPDNTVGIVTSVSLSNWQVVDALPTTQTSNVAYIVAGSGTAVTVGRRLNLHLKECRLNGKLMNAYIRKDGAWVQFGSSWDGSYFNAGEQYQDITGGWTSNGYSYLEFTPVAGTVGSALNVAISKYYEMSVLGTANKVSLKDVDTLRITVSAASNAEKLRFYVLSSKNLSDSVRELSFAGAGEKTVDVSGLTGSYYLAVAAIGVGASNPYNLSATVTKVKGE